MSGSPTAIGRYQVLRELGAGAMGVVYLAQDPTLKRKVAIKCMKERGTQNASVLERFRREAETSSRLNHPNVITIYDVGEDPEAGPFMAMEYVEGASLATLIERRALSQDAGFQILTQLMYGLLAAGNAGIIHRDVKPENILVSNDGRVKLMDFGIAKGDESRLTTTGMVVGTPSYTAPELLLGKDASYHTDLYAFSVTAFEVVTGGQLPYTGDSLGVTLYRIVHEAPTFPPDLSPSLNRVFEKALQKTPAQRHHDLPDFMTDLAQGLGFAPPPLPAGGFAPPPLTVGVSQPQRASQDDIRTGYVPSNTPQRASQGGHGQAQAAAQPGEAARQLAPPPTDLLKHGRQSGTELPSRTPGVNDPHGHPAGGTRQAPPPHKAAPPKEQDVTQVAKNLVIGAVVLAGGIWGYFQWSQGRTRLVTVASEPPGAYVEVDGVEIGRTAAGQPFSQPVKASAKRLTLRFPAYRTEHLEIPEGEWSPGTIRLKLQEGFIRIKSSPVGATVVIDGVALGTPTPVWSHEVGNKPVTLEVRLKGYDSRVFHGVSDKNPPPDLITLVPSK